jgi:hypothetical protein
MQNVHCQVVGTAWADAAGHKNPPSAPPAIPPIIITPFNRIIQIPPAIDPLNVPPGPPIMPPGVPVLRM